MDSLSSCSEQKGRQFFFEGKSWLYCDVIVWHSLFQISLYWPFNVRNVLVIWDWRPRVFKMFQITSFSLSLELFFLTEGRNKIWKQNTSLFNRWKIMFCFLLQSLVRHYWYLLTLQILEISRNRSKYGMKVTYHKILSLNIDLMTDIRLSNSCFECPVSNCNCWFQSGPFYFCLSYFVLCLKLD